MKINDKKFQELLSEELLSEYEKEDSEQLFGDWLTKEKVEEFSTQLKKRLITEGHELALSARRDEALLKKMLFSEARYSGYKGKFADWLKVYEKNK